MNHVHLPYFIDKVSSRTGHATHECGTKVTHHKYNKQMHNGQYLVNDSCLKISSTRNVSMQR